MQDLFAEVRELPPGAAIAQGDVLASVAEEPGTYERLLIVVTADCDLAHEKHAGHISCVPVLEARTYAVHHLLDRDVKKLEDELETALSGEIRRSQQRDLDPGAAPIGRERAIRWALEEGADSVQKTLPSFRIDRMQPIIEALATLESAPREFDPLIEAIGRGRAALNNGSPPEIIARHLGNLRGRLLELPGDAMFLSRIGPDHDRGYVAYLRLLPTVARDHIAVNVPETLQGRAYERIARLRSPYIYGLTQRLAAVFSSIGLPSDYEEARSSQIAHICRTESG